MNAKLKESNAFFFNAVLFCYFFSIIGKFEKEMTKYTIIIIKIAGYYTAFILNPVLDFVKFIFQKLANLAENWL